LIRIFFSQERGKYARLHLLCLMCGKFGHYVEGCPEKEKQHSWNGRSEVANDNGQGGKDSGVGQHIPEGPWTIVKKMRHPRRGKERDNGDPNLMHA